ncbi:MULTISPECIES: putative entry exclusion protein TrbK-alt [unclassified Phenylobacterium]|uniref:putative entry exclusion protein TrbK-alt n=1 Tax=unclassified Phenylobacterium TaxID=2640670 RepID=UPI0009EA3DF7
MKAQALLAALLALEGCNGPSTTVPTSDPALAAELKRCRGLGLQAYDSSTCRAAQQEQQRRFFTPSGGADEPRRR